MYPPTYTNSTNMLCYPSPYCHSGHIIRQGKHDTNSYLPMSNLNGTYAIQVVCI